MRGCAVWDAHQRFFIHLNNYAAEKQTRISKGFQQPTKPIHLSWIEQKELLLNIGWVKTETIRFSFFPSQ